MACSDSRIIYGILTWLLLNPVYLKIIISSVLHRSQYLLLVALNNVNVLERLNSKEVQDKLLGHQRRGGTSVNNCQSHDAGPLERPNDQKK